MFAPLEAAAAEFAAARDAFAKARRAQDPETGLQALMAALENADAILTFLGFVEPYECGDCDACQANADARRDAMQAAVDDDPDLSPNGPNGPHLTDAQEADVRRLLALAFGDDYQPEGNA